MKGPAVPLAPCPGCQHTEPHTPRLGCTHSEDTEHGTRKYCPCLLGPAGAGQVLPWALPITAGRA